MPIDKEIIDLIEKIQSNSILIGLGSGLLGGIISPFLLSFLKHKFVWKSEKRIEFKKAIFDDTVKALSMYSTDALNIELQAKKQGESNLSKKTKMRVETEEIMENSRAMVKAFFSENAALLYDEALRTRISIESVPNIDFEEKRTKAIITLAEEIGIKK